MQESQQQSILPHSVVHVEADTPGTDIVAAALKNPITSERLQTLMEMVGSASRAQTPQAMYDTFSRGLNKLSSIEGYISLSVRGLQPGEFKITRALLRGRRRGEATDPWSEWDHISIRTGGIFGRFIRSAWPVVINDLNVADDPAIGDLLWGFRSLMAAPIFDHGEPLNWAIALADSPNEFPLDRLEEFVLRANLIGGMTKTIVVSNQLRTANERINKQVAEIAAIQRLLLPDPLPDIPGVEVASHYATSELAGGDYYDFFPLEDARFGVLIADASGHGPSAAVVMAMLHSILHAFARHAEHPASMLEHANRELCGKRMEGSFVTAIYGEFDPVSRTFRYARAGHNPALLRRAGGRIEQLDEVGSFPLGIEPSLTLEEATITLEPGDTLLLHTDGVTEAMSATRHMFGTAGIERALTHCNGTAQCTVHSIRDAVLEHQGPGGAKDDQTLLAMHVLA